MSATLYAVHSSHPAHAAHLMLAHKGIDHRVVSLVPGTHAALVRALGFKDATVPALLLDGHRVQGSRAISRALDRRQPEPPLFPADPQLRFQVEQAESWGDEVLQPVPRRLAGWINVNGPQLRIKLAREAGVPAAGLVGLAGWPLARYFAARFGATDTEAIRGMVATLPALLDHVGALLEAGTIGGEHRNAADFQIATTVRLLISFADLAPLFRGRRAAAYATDLMPTYPTGVPAGLVPADWVAPAARSGTGVSRAPGT